MSSRVNLGLLVDHINFMLRETVQERKTRGDIPHLDPNLKFKILYSSPTTTNLPPLNQHFPESFFSFDVSTEELKKLGRRSLRSSVDSAFEGKVAAYVDLLKPTSLPEDVLYFILPFIYGGEDCLTDEMLLQIVSTTKRLLAEASPRKVSITSSTSKKGGKGRKRERA